jgi:hypothetical protein
MSLEEVAALVSTTLARHGIRSVLSGGAVVSIYSDNAYESKDLDFIIEGIAKKEDPAMEELGFRKEAGRYWTHPRTEFWIEFPSGPLQVGNAPVRSVKELETSTGVLRLLAPTESGSGLERRVRRTRRASALFLNVWADELRVPGASFRSSSKARELEGGRAVEGVHKDAF